MTKPVKTPYVAVKSEFAPGRFYAVMVREGKEDGRPVLGHFKSSSKTAVAANRRTARVFINIETGAEVLVHSDNSVEMEF